MRFDITARRVSILVFCDVKPYGFVSKYQRFGGEYCLHLQLSRWRQYERWYLPTSAHDAVTKKSADRSLT
jgi:hypothetical protein